MNKYKKISISAIASMAVLGTTVFATTGKVYNTTNGLVLRATASTTGDVITTIANDTNVEILENNDKWYKVNVNGKEGYLYAEYVKVEEEKTETSNLETANVESNTSEENNNNEKTNGDTKIHILPTITSSGIGVIPAGTEVEKKKTVGNWSYVTYGEVSGWIRTVIKNEEVKSEEQPVQEEEKPEEQKLEETQETKPEETQTPQTENTNLSFTKGYINSSSVNVRKEPSKSSEIVTNLILNTGVTITAQTDEWYKVEYGEYKGYIFKELISDKPVVTSRNAEARTALINEEEANASQVENVETKSETVAASNTSSAAGENIVSFAKQYLGYRYVYGGTTPGGGFDCSGFVYYVFNSCGYSLSRSCTVQAQSGVAVSRSELQPGDILFFNNTSNGAIGHTGIYIGDGRFIHAANPNRGVVTDTINSGYYNTYYYSARRIVK